VNEVVKTVMKEGVRFLTRSTC